MKLFILLGIFLTYTLLIFSQEAKTNLPTFYITTDGNKPVSSKETWVQGNISVVSSDETESFSMATEIRGRGNSTWGMAKKPYRIKLSSKTNLLNLPAKEKNWVLLANYADKTLIRNAVAFKISELVGLEFTPSARFVDVVLNGNFLGNYMVSDQMEVADKRVPVQTQKETDTNLPQISGGYLLEIDGFASGEPVWFRTNKGVPITIKYPKHDEINAQQREYIETFTKNFENKLFSENFNDENSGYRPFVDEKSLVNWYICCELTGNPDSFWSTYIYKYRNIDKLFFGPLWDYDIAFNNDNRLGDATRKLMRNHAHNPRTWIQRLWEDEWFRNAVDARWKELMQENILETLLEYIDQTAVLLEQSQQLNFEKWKILNSRIYLEQYIFPTYRQGVDYLKTYLTERVNCLNDNLVSANTNPSEPFVAEDFYYMILNEATSNVINVSNQSISLNAKLNMWAPINGNEVQQWIIKSLGNDRFQIINRNSNLAMAGTGNIDNLIQVTPNASNNAQQWKITPVLTGNMYALVNVKSGYVADNSGGSFSNGTAVIEYYNEIYHNQNQQWYIQKVEAIDSSSIPKLESEDKLSVFPNPAKANVFVTLPADIDAEFMLRLYRIDGSCVYQSLYTLTEKSEILTIPLESNNIMSGFYILKIECENGNYYSSKLIVK